MDGLWLQRVHGIASRWRTCASSEAFSGWVGAVDLAAIGAVAAYVRFGFSVQRVALATCDAAFNKLGRGHEAREFLVR